MQNSAQNSVCSTVEQGFEKPLELSNCINKKFHKRACDKTFALKRSAKAVAKIHFTEKDRATGEYTKQIDTYMYYFPSRHVTMLD